MGLNVGSWLGLNVGAWLGLNVGAWLGLNVGAMVVSNTGFCRHWQQPLSLRLTLVRGKESREGRDCAIIFTISSVMS